MDEWMVELEGVECPIQRETTLEELAERCQPDFQAPIVLAVVNNKLAELTRRITNGDKIHFVTTAETPGSEAYERSLLMLLNKAVYDVLPPENRRRVIAHFSIDRGVFLEIEGCQSDEAMKEQIQARMEELVEENLPFRKFSMHVDAAREYFRKNGMQDKDRMFRYRRSSYINLYDLDGYVDYYYGYMVPGTGVLKKFELLTYERGFTLRTPDRKKQEITPFVPQTKLYSLMLTETDFCEHMHCANVADINDRIASGHAEDLILEAEARQEARIAEIASQIAAKTNVKFVMIAGPSSSGKTSFSHRLSVQLRTRGLVPHPVAVDDYFVDRDKTPRDENGEYDFEALEGVDIEQFNRDMNALLEGQEVPMPTFDFLEGKRTYRGNTLKIGPNDILVIEGIHCLNDKLSYSLPQESKFRIYISALTQLNIDDHNRIHTTDGRLIRRMIRDARTRGHNAKATIARWQSVRRGEEKNIFPYQEKADVMFNSSLAYEFSIMKPFAEQLLYAISETDPEYMEANRLLKLFDYFLTMSPESVPRNSLLKEFIGGSIFPV